MQGLQQVLMQRALQPGASLHRREAQQQSQRGQGMGGRRERREARVRCSQSSMLGRFSQKAPAHWTQSDCQHRVLWA